MFSSQDIITGEKLQHIADICFLDTYNPNYKKFSKNFHFVNIPYPQNKVSALNGKVLYFPTHLIDYFFKYIYPHINSCKIITHNSDHGILDHHPEHINRKILKALNSPKIIKWFSQNINMNHSKLIALPIGIANSMWPHGNLHLLNEIMNEKVDKNKLYYFNFNMNTRIDRRKPIYDQCIKNGLKFTPMMNHKRYLINLKSSKFCICPPGNGYDCHRLWEAIYLGCIPIVIDIPAYSQFKDLPILFINDWKIVTEDFLNKKYKELKNKNFNYDRAKLTYYSLKILE